MSFRSTSLFAALALSLSASAAHGAERSTVHAGHVIDVETGKVLADQAIGTEDGRIVSISAWNASTASGHVIDWSAYTVVPGLMDMHTHIADEGPYADPATPLKSNPGRDALIGAKNARATLQAGFTTVRDVGVFRGLSDVILRDAINAGLVPGPRMYVAGAYITIDGGGGEITGLPAGTVVAPEFRLGVSDDEAEIREHVDYLLDHGADFIKIIATGAVLAAGTEPGESEYTEAEIRAAVEEAAKRGTFVAAHAHGAEGIKRAIRAGVRSIEHGSLMDDEAIAMMKEHGTWLVADIYDGDYIDSVGRADGWSEEILRKNLDTTDAQREGFRKAVKLGVNLAFGTDSGVYPHGDNARQFAYMVKYGMTPLQALQSATISSARLLGKEKETGSIAVGKSADLVAVGCDPLQDIECLRKVRGVVKAGQPVALD
ncbi:Xaa-Pro dipeptidase [Pseudoxanthomonas yeongjuensis]|uniref:Xaa-Pro dipeptidase n=1 Tax=Pseudoxanthomonas yeongjuensis TaxID=377616 RepID=UPI00139202B8|nr:amidohydrolase family protein [Pseudoxanthomonas yeongjuensis]KAF1716348.1 Xaa-Pro dipeptidase [Pseudoxanthomonas yeongjuensis]